MVAYRPFSKNRTSCLVSLVFWKVWAFCLSAAEYTSSPGRKNPANATLKAVSKLSALMSDLFAGDGDEVIRLSMSLVIGRRFQNRAVV
jgi:hypothetical protein